MRAAGQLMPWTRRSLVECCAAAGLPDRNWHTARDDALAAADRLGHVLRVAPTLIELTSDHRQAAAWAWPALPRTSVTPVQRTPLGHVEPHFLARLVDRIPRTGEPVTDSYLAMLDAALLDRQICATEADALVDLAHDLGLPKSEVVDIHHRYLRALAEAVWSDGVLTDDERRDVDTVATLLALDPTVVIKSFPTLASCSSRRDRPKPNSSSTSVDSPCTPATRSSLLAKCSAAAPRSPLKPKPPACA
jgi:DNA polymerase-3 subunit epsilon